MKKHREAIFFEHRKIILLVSVLIIILSYLFADITVANDFKTLSPQWKHSVAFVTKLIDPKYHNYIWPLLFFFHSLHIKTTDLGESIASHPH